MLKNSNVEQLQADVNAKQSVVDTLTKDIESAKADIDKTTKAIADIELKVAREDATKSINSLKYVVASEKADFTNQLNATLTQDTINTIVTAAQAKDATNKAELDLKTSKTNTVSEINGLKFLSDKQSFTDKANAAGSIDAVASILSEAKTQDAAEQLTKSKVDAIADVNAISGLNDSEKASFADKINASTALNDVASAVSDAKTVAKLNTYKESAKTTVSNLTKLSDESKAGYTNRIKSATSTTNVDTIVAEAKAESQLIQDKESAVSEIKALVNLSDKEQASFVDAVTNAASKSAVDTVVSTAKAQGQKNLEAKQLEELRVDVKAKISAMDYLSDAQKQDFASKVDAAVTKTAVSDLLVNANATNGLEKAKSEATTEINNLKYLSTDAKSEFTAKVAAAKAKDAIAPIVSDANTRDALIGLQNDASAKGKPLTYISADQKAEAVAQIKATTTASAIKPISDVAVKAEAVAKELRTAKDASLEKAKGYVANLIAHLKVAENNAITKKLSDAKVRANTTINIMKFLQPGQKDDFVKRANSAKDMAALKAVIDAAQVQDTIESHKGTVTFTFVGPDAKIVKMVTQSIKEGNVYVTYKQLGLTKDQVKFVLGAKVVGGVSGGLTVTIEAQKDKPVMILI